MALGSKVWQRWRWRRSHLAQLVDLQQDFVHRILIPRGLHVVNNNGSTAAVLPTLPVRCSVLPATRRLRLNQSSSCTPLLDAHGEVKYNAWEKPTEIAKWCAGQLLWKACSAHVLARACACARTVLGPIDPEHAPPTRLLTLPSPPVWSTQEGGAHCVPGAWRLGCGHLGRHEGATRGRPGNSRGRAPLRQLFALLCSSCQIVSIGAGAGADF